MRKTAFILLGIAALTLGSTTARAQQPVSVSMVECAVIYDVVARSAEARGRPDEMVEQFSALSENFMNAAAEQAAAEGVADVEDHITDTYKEVSPEWEGKIGSILQLPDTLEWIRYCGALAHDRGLVPE